MQQVRFPGESPELRRARALRERVDDLRGARQRIIAAADAERRRIERDLHDGAQQRMVAVAITLGLAQAQVASDPEGAARLIAQAREEAQLAVKELRELARGIHPAVLSDHGLGAGAGGARRPRPRAGGGHRRPRVSAAPGGRGRGLLRHRRGADQRRQVRAVRARPSSSCRSRATACRVQVRDDGVGGADPSIGSGLRGLSDRVDALDGQLEVDSPEGAARP